MKTVQLIGTGLVMLALAVMTGCSNQQGGTPKGGSKTAKKSEVHSHGAGPHGGAVADWGGGKYHIEFCMDHDKKQATVYVLGGDAEKAASIKADKLLLSIKEPSFQIELTPLPQEGEAKGTSSRFVGIHDNFGKVQEFAGTISGEVNGRPYAGEFKEEPEEAGKAKK